MTKDQNCAYCVHGEPLAKFGIYICDLTQTRLYLFKEQSHPGRVILANKDHVGCITDLSDEERNAFFADVAHVTRALNAAFHPGSGTSRKWLSALPASSAVRRTD